MDATTHQDTEAGSMHAIAWVGKHHLHQPANSRVYVSSVTLQAGSRRKAVEPGTGANRLRIAVACCALSLAAAAVRRQQPCLEIKSTYVNEDSNLRSSPQSSYSQRPGRVPWPNRIPHCFPSLAWFLDVPGFL